MEEESVEPGFESRRPGKEVVLTRFFLASTAQVFRAWTDAARLAAWWGPEGYTAPACSLDVRKGGQLYIEMQGPEGEHFPVKGQYQNVDEPEQLVFTTTALQDAKGEPGLRLVNTVIFTPEKHGTRLTLQAVVMQSTPGAAAVLGRLEQDWKETLDRLERLIRSIHFTIVI